jgi:threonine dehydrogenase-like Zn-dependent dehydrogenase
MPYANGRARSRREMNAIAYASQGRVRTHVVPEPAILEPTDAIVRVSLAGICGTDLHLIGGHAAGVDAGLVLGHEFVGEIVEIGASVRAVRVGERVLASDFTACGLCRWCDRGEHWECAERRFFGTGLAFGPALAGAQAEYVRVPLADVTLSGVPAGISDETAILVCDNLPTGWAAIDLGGLAPGETVAIVGGGPIGQLAALCAQVAGAAAVVVVEPNPVRRAFASERGSLAVDIDAAPGFVREITSGDGADLVIEAGGLSATLDASFALVRRRGRIVSVGVHASPTWPLPLGRAFADEISLRFAIGDSIRYRRKLFALLGSGVLDATGIVQSRVSLAEAPRTYERMARGEILKAAIAPRSA